MKLSFQIGAQQATIDTDAPIDISLPLVSGAQNPTCYYADAPIFEVIRAGDWVGSVAEGGCCNHQKITFTPHGNGTHTECYGHISADEGATVPRCLRSFWFVAQLLTISPTQRGEDAVITGEAVASHLHPEAEALVLRTLPNDESKRARAYSGTNPPYLEAAVGEALAARNIRHLLVDLPSVDREVDGGALATHHAFWQYPHATRRDCTITELIFVPNDALDGLYILHLQVPSIELDAVPSKPVLYQLERYK